MYKQKLQELCQKKKLALPKYSCMRDGPDHDPQFKASVIVDRINFDTETICKSSKQATNEAAKFAFLHFTSGSKEASDEEKEVESPRVHSNTLGTKTGKSSETGLLSHTSSKGQIAKVSSAQGNSKPEYPSQVKEIKGEDEDTDSTESIVYTKKEESLSLPTKESSSVMTTLPELSHLLISEKTSMKNTKEPKSYLLNSRVRVYTSIPDIVLSKGNVLLPIAESRWVVVSLEFPN